MFFSADEYEFMACTQEEDGALLPPQGKDWFLINTNAAEDGNAAILIATWARKRSLSDRPLTAPAD